MEIYSSITTDEGLYLITRADNHTEDDFTESNKKELLLTPLLIFAVIGVSCLAAVITRRFSTRIKQLCGFHLSRSESARQSKKCRKEEDDF